MRARSFWTSECAEKRPAFIPSGSLAMVISSSSNGSTVWPGMPALPAPVAGHAEAVSAAAFNHRPDCRKRRRLVVIDGLVAYFLPLERCAWIFPRGDVAARARLHFAGRNLCANVFSSVRGAYVMP